MVFEYEEVTFTARNFSAVDGHCFVTSHPFVTSRLIARSWWYSPVTTITIYNCLQEQCKNHPHPSADKTLLRKKKITGERPFFDWIFQIRQLRSKSNDIQQHTWTQILVKRKFELLTILAITRKFIFKFSLVTFLFF